jgi:hypothetical protein
MSRARFRPWEILGEISNNDCKKHKATQSLEEKMQREFTASNGVEN